MQLTPYLEDLEARIDAHVEERNQAAWLRFWRQPEGDFFVAPARPPAPPCVEWPAIPINDALDDLDAMALREFKSVSDVLAAGGGSRLNIRCNYGTGILPSLFGCRLFLMERDQDTLPAVWPLGSAAALQAALDRGPPDIRSALGGKVFACLDHFQRIMRPYPRISRWVEIYHPDLQGPVDVLEVVWGSDMFLGVLDRADLFAAALERITGTYIEFLGEWVKRAGPPGEYTTHWGATIRGLPMLRNDSLMNLSPATYVAHIRPLDQRIFDAFGGWGGVHFCGRGDHFIGALSEMRGLGCIAMSQPHLNDMEAIYRHTVDKGIRLIGLSPAEVSRALLARRPLRGLVHVWRAV